MVLWLLFTVICAYNVLDVYQTQALFEFGLVEGNPILLFLMKNSQDMNTIIIFKCATLLFLGIMIFIYNRKQSSRRRFVK